MDARQRKLQEEELDNLTRLSNVAPDAEQRDRYLAQAEALAKALAKALAEDEMSKAAIPAQKRADPFEGTAWAGLLDAVRPALVKEAVEGDVRKAGGEITRFWMVTDPKQWGDGANTELVDILSEHTPQNIGLQFKGGLEPKDVVGFYSSESSATRVAQGLLAQVTGEKAAVPGDVRKAGGEDDKVIFDFIDAMTEAKYAFAQARAAANRQKDDPKLSNLVNALISTMNDASKKLEDLRSYVSGEKAAVPGDVRKAEGQQWKIVTVTLSGESTVAILNATNQMDAENQLKAFANEHGYKDWHRATQGLDNGYWENAAGDQVELRQTGTTGKVAKAGDEEPNGWEDADGYHINQGPDYKANDYGADEPGYSDYESGAIPTKASSAPDSAELCHIFTSHGFECKSIGKYTVLVSLKGRAINSQEVQTVLDQEGFNADPGNGFIFERVGSGVQVTMEAVKVQRVSMRKAR